MVTAGKKEVIEAGLIALVTAGIGILAGIVTDELNERREEAKERKKKKGEPKAKKRG